VFPVIVSAVFAFLAQQKQATTKDQEDRLANRGENILKTGEAVAFWAR